MTDLDLMTDRQLVVMAWLAVGAWSYLVALAWIRHRASRRRSTYRPPNRWHY